MYSTRKPIKRKNSAKGAEFSLSHGGGEGRQGRGLRRAKSAWGKPTGKGQKTRTPKKYSNVFIISRRKVGKNRKA